MKLSDIVGYKNLLNSLTCLESKAMINKELGPSLHAVLTGLLTSPEKGQLLCKNLADIHSQIDVYIQTLDSIKDDVQQLINNAEPDYLNESFRLYSEEMVNDSTVHILNRRLAITPETDEFIKNRISIYSDWQHPGIILRPGIESWITNLVGLDPLYLVDEREELVSPALRRFNAEYQRRLRTYEVNEQDKAPIFKDLPDGQFSFCFAYNFFHYKPISIFSRYIEEAFTKLKPGGVFALTFNDGDRAGGVELAERNFMVYTPWHMIKSIAEKTGYEILRYDQLDHATTWVEIKKPGELTSLRGGQSLARLVAKP